MTRRVAAESVASRDELVVTLTRRGRRASTATPVRAGLLVGYEANLRRGGDWIASFTMRRAGE